MQVHVLHHARCFDGVASAALFAAFHRTCIAPSAAAATYRFLPKRHRRGDPFDPADFRGDVNACVDFRYSQHPELHWFFDHHVSAFQLAGDRAHFDADTSGQKFHDAEAPCCAGFVAEIASGRWGFDPTPHHELLEWARIIDTAAFPDPAFPVELRPAAMQLATFIQTLDDPNTVATLVEDLLEHSIDEVVARAYVQAALGPRLDLHHADVAMLASRLELSSGVASYDVVDEGPRLLSHFIPYFHAPECRYAVGLYRHPDGDLRLTVGFNPWLEPSSREHDLAILCARHGGGGHPHVAGASFAADELDRAREAYADAVRSLGGGGPRWAHAG